MTALDTSVAHAALASWHERACEARRAVTPDAVVLHMVMERMLCSRACLSCSDDASDGYNLPSGRIAPDAVMHDH